LQPTGVPVLFDAKKKLFTLALQPSGFVKGTYKEMVTIGDPTLKVSRNNAGQLVFELSSHGIDSTAPHVDRFPYTTPE
jgi:hypothetical protein